MKSRRMKLGGLLFAILACSLLGGYFSMTNNGESNTRLGAGQTLSLVKPVFAQSSSSNITFLEEEAGMSVWVNIDTTLNLTKAKSAYKYIEEETSEYIIGAVSLPGYPETEDVHCFIQKDGWIVVYYLRHEPTSKIIDLKYYNSTTGQLTTTKLQIGLEKVVNALGISMTEAQYYNFQYPSADEWMIIIESIETGTEDSFRIMIPSEFTVYEKSWSLYTTAYGVHLFVDGELIGGAHTADGGWAYGVLSQHFLSPDAFHTITVRRSYGFGTQHAAIILIYKEP